MKEHDSVRDAFAELNAEITPSLTLEKESETAQMRLVYGQALAHPKLVVDFLDAKIEVVLEPEHVDMLADFTYNIQRMNRND